MRENKTKRSQQGNFMNIVLIYPLLSRQRSAVDENKQYWPPLGLAYIASALERQGHKVRIIDRDALLHKHSLSFSKADEETLRLIKDFHPDLVGFSATTPNMSDVFQQARTIKDSFPGVKIIVGGPHPTGEPEATLRLSQGSIDALCLGEGELTMLDIAAGKSFSEVKSLSFIRDGLLVSTQERPLIPDIDELPLPARHLLDMEFYSRPSRFTSRNLNLRTTSIFTARGCPYRCNFCAGPLVFSGRVRFHSPQRVIAEVEHIIRDYAIEALYFAEDMFLSDKERAYKLLTLFRDRGIHKKIKWFAQVRTNMADEELLKFMKSSGCSGVEYGFESGSQRILERMNKRSTVGENLRAARITRKVGLRYQANIIVGYPGETRQDFYDTISFLKKIQPSNIGFNIFMPLPGTAEYARLKKEGRISYDWENVGNPEGSGVNYTAMSDKEFKQAYSQARLKIVLPLNLKNFITDNIKNPFRFIYLAITQFRGLLIKTIRSDLKAAFKQ